MCWAVRHLPKTKPDQKHVDVNKCKNTYYKRLLLCTANSYDSKHSVTDCYNDDDSAASKMSLTWKNLPRLTQRAVDKVIMAFPASQVSACYFCKSWTRGTLSYCAISGTGCAKHGRAFEDHNERNLRSLCINCSRAFILQVVNQEIRCHVDGCERTLQLSVRMLACAPELSSWNEMFRCNMLRWVGLLSVGHFCHN